MMVDFQKIFNPTEEDKQERVINYLKLLISSIENKDCSNCKHCELKTTYEHEYETVSTYCKIKDEIVYENCKNYEIDDEELLKYQAYDRKVIKKFIEKLCLVAICKSGNRSDWFVGLNHLEDEMKRVLKEEFGSDMEIDLLHRRYHNGMN